MSDLVGDAVPDREFGVIALRSPMIREVSGPEHVHEVGCSTVLREAKRLPDGRFDVVTTARRRFRLLELDRVSAPYLIASVEWVPDDRVGTVPGDTVTRLADVAKTAHRRYCESAWHADDWVAPPDDTDIHDLAYRLTADCLIPLEDRQHLLEETNPLRRLRIACRLLTREAGFLTTLGAVPMPPGELGEFTRPSSLN